jgi:hypothetical protein
MDNHPIVRARILPEHPAESQRILDLGFGISDLGRDRKLGPWRFAVVISKPRIRRAGADLAVWGLRISKGLLRMTACRRCGLSGRFPFRGATYKGRSQKAERRSSRTRGGTGADRQKSGGAGRAFRFSAFRAEGDAPGARVACRAPP